MTRYTVFIAGSFVVGQREARERGLNPRGHDLVFCYPGSNTSVLQKLRGLPQGSVEFVWLYGWSDIRTEQLEEIRWIESMLA